MTPVFQDEVMLAGWSESHNGGAKVTFWLSDPSALDAFRAMTVAKGKTAGQRLACVLVEIGDDEKPVNADVGIPIAQENQQLAAEKPKGGPLAKLAGMWCEMPLFWDFLLWKHEYTVSNEPDAAKTVYELCGITSRAELDHNEQAAQKFKSLIRGPFQKYMLARGVVL